MTDLRNFPNNMNEAPVCSGCRKPIYDGTVFKVNGGCWHNACLRCVVCHNNVKEFCHMKGNEIFCRSDFIRLFGTKCASCFKVVSPAEAACITNGNVFHPACLRCVLCDDNIQTGTQFYMREDFKIVCKKDFLRQKNQAAFPQSESETDESGSDETYEHQPMCLSCDQLRMLNGLYTYHKRPSRHERQELCKQTGLTGRQVQIWFKNRRAKEKRKKLNGWTDKVHQNQAEINQNTWQTTNTMKNNYSMEPPANFQVYCPLDFMDPGSMPPNIELCPDDLCNGEVIAGKQNTSQIVKNVSSACYVTNNQLSNWLTA